MKVKDLVAAHQLCRHRWSRSLGELTHTAKAAAISWLDRPHGGQPTEFRGRKEHRQMNSDQNERRTERIHEVLGEVLEGSGVDLARVVRAVRDVNETLVVHGAWTDERFEAVDDRLSSLARIQVMTSGKVEVVLAGVDARLVGLAAGQSEVVQVLARLEENQAELMGRQMAVCQTIERLEQGQQSLRREVAALVGTVQGLTGQLREMLMHVISNELEQMKGGLSA